MVFTRVGTAGLFLGLALLSSGCGGKGTISGKVYYQDQLLGGGTVTFTNADGKGSQVAQIQPDGSYTLERMPSGPAKIGVETTSAKPTATPGKRGGAPKMPQGPPPDQVPEGADPSKIYGSGRTQGLKYVPIPESYKDPETSGVQYTVTSGPQEHDIRLP